MKRKNARGTPRTLEELRALPPDGVLSLSEAALLAGRKKQNLHVQAIRGNLPSEQIGPYLFYRKRHVEAFAAKEKRPGWPKGVKRLAVIHVVPEITIPPAVQEDVQGP